MGPAPSKACLLGWGGAPLDSGVVASVRILLLLALCGSCASIEDDDWRFRLSREFYWEFAGKMDANEPVFEPEWLARRKAGERMDAMILPFMLSMPLVLDVCFLPVTAPRDLWMD